MSGPQVAHLDFTWAKRRWEDELTGGIGLPLDAARDGDLVELPGVACERETIVHFTPNQHTSGKSNRYATSGARMLPLVHTLSNLEDWRILAYYMTL